MPTQQEPLIECTLQLFRLKAGALLSTALDYLTQNASSSAPYILKGRPHGWVLPPLRHNMEQLLAHDWDLFLLAQNPLLPELANMGMIEAQLSIRVGVPKSQFDPLVAQKDTVPQPNAETPQLPQGWGGEEGIPSSTILSSDKDGPLDPGELKLYPSMANFLSTTLPEEVRHKPVSLMNLFKYPNGDPGVHNSYMEGFKDNFGNTAGASVKFMGPTRSAIKYEDFSSSSSGSPPAREEGAAAGDVGGMAETRLWDDANLVQYDSIWHYAYMLSTDVYQELNKEKVRGLEDTCILLVSEVEVVR